MSQASRPEAVPKPPIIAQGRDVKRRLFRQGAPVSRSGEVADRRFPWAMMKMCR